MQIRACEGDLNLTIGTCSGEWVLVDVSAIQPLSIADQMEMFDLWLPILIIAFGANLIVRKVM